jgi:hypothetical protein
LLVPYEAFASIEWLGVLLRFFRRPDSRVSTEYYRHGIELEGSIDDAILSTPDLRPKVTELIENFYVAPKKTLIVDALTSRDFEAAIMALWSQQWPALRTTFTFCTGSLSARFLGTKPLELQCVPRTSLREVMRDTRLNAYYRQQSESDDIRFWAELAATFATSHDDVLRRFLWNVADGETGRESYSRFGALFVFLTRSAVKARVPALVELIGRTFPERGDAVRMKQALLGPPDLRIQRTASEREILSAIAATEFHHALDPDALKLEKRAQELWSTASKDAGVLLREFFVASLNPLGERIFRGLISGITITQAKSLAEEQPNLLPELFRANPRLATSSSLWSSEEYRARELFDAVSSEKDLSPDLTARIVRALLSADIPGVQRPVMKRWGGIATHELLTWVDTHGQEVSESWRSAAAAQEEAILQWLDSNPSPSPPALLFLVKVLDPSSNAVQQHGSAVWLRALDKINKSGNKKEAAPIYAFALSLGFLNVPPNPLKLVRASFSHVHELAAMDELDYESWHLLKPHVPELHWNRNWDKCERLQRGLINAFVTYKWPLEELLQCASDTAALASVRKSARKVEGGKNLIKELVAEIDAGNIRASKEQRSVLEA